MSVVRCTFALLRLVPLLAAIVPRWGSTGLLAQSAPSLTVTSVPDSVALHPGRAADVVVVVRNASAKPLRDVRLSWFTNSRLDVTTVDSLSAPLLAPGGALIARLAIVGREQAERTGTVITRVDFTREAPAGRDVAFRQVTIRPANALAPDEMLDVQVNASLATLTERQDARLYLVLRNKADVPITIEGLTVTPPSFLTASQPPTVVIPPKSVTTVPVTIAVVNRVRPGKHQVLLDIPVRWTSAEEPRHLVIAREVDVGVLGESAILSVLGVPSFLVLPGFLMVLTFATLWKWRVLRPQTSSASIDLSAKEPEFWLLAITLSGLLAVTYPFLTGRDYLDAYDVGDVARIWLLSTFVVGAGGYLAVMGALWIRHLRRIPREDDNEGIILAKAVRRGFDLNLPRVKVGAVEAEAIALEPQRTEGAPIWVTPRIKWDWIGDNDDDDARKYRAELETLTARGRLRPLADALLARQKELRVRLSFEAVADGGIASPRRFEIKDVAWEGSTEPIVSKTGG